MRSILEIINIVACVGGRKGLPVDVYYVCTIGLSVSDCVCPCHLNVNGRLIHYGIPSTARSHTLSASYLKYASLARRACTLIFFGWLAL